VDNVLLVTNERAATDRVRAFLAATSFSLVGIDIVDHKASEFIKNNISVDTIIVFGMMPALDLKKRISGTKPALVVVTPYAESAVEAYGNNFRGFVLDPVRRESLLSSLQGARDRTVSYRKSSSLDRNEGDSINPSGITIRFRGNLSLIPIEDIYYFQADNKYVNVSHRGGVGITELSLKTIEKNFPDELFRIHRGILVNKPSIKGFEKSANGSFKATLSGTDDKLDISRRHVSSYRRYLRNLGAV